MEPDEVAKLRGAHVADTELMSQAGAPAYDPADDTGQFRRHSQEKTQANQRAGFSTRFQASRVACLALSQLSLERSLTESQLRLSAVSASSND